MGETLRFKGTMEVPALGYRAVKDGGQIIAVTKQVVIKISTSDEGCFELCERLRYLIGMPVTVTVTPQQEEMLAGFREDMAAQGVTVRAGGVDSEAE